MVKICRETYHRGLRGAELEQLSFFNGHYDNWCYLPVLGFVSFNEEAEQYLCAAVSRPGNVTAAVGAVGLLRRLVAIIRSCFPGV
jgi:hypothetical protein